MSNPILECYSPEVTSGWYDKLAEEVDYHCSFCEGVLLTIADLESKVKRAYEATADSMEGLFDVKEIANRWLATYYLASEIFGVAQATSQVHQLCGADLSAIAMYRDEAWERYSYHCPQACVA